MEQEFYNVVSEARRYELSSDKNTDMLRGALTRLEKEVKKAGAEVLADFVSIYWSEIVRVVTILRGIQNSAIRGTHDRIFTNTLGVQKRLPTDLTILFGKFIKGVTYFQNQTTTGIDTPVYHRLNSCGPGDDAFRNAFQRCTQDMDKQDRTDIRTRIETCYIERLVYDYMYRKLAMFFPSTGTEDIRQDIKHMERLSLTRKDFQTCFPNLRIEIDMDFDNMHWPTELVIRRYVRDKLASTEKYTRNVVFNSVLGARMYEDAVEATRETEKYRYFRVQRFVYRPAWKRV